MATSTNWLFELRGTLSKSQSLILAVIGGLIFLGIWVMITAGASPMMPSQLLPSPSRVIGAFGDLYRDNDLIKNTTLSLALNYAGYIKAILWGIPLGYLIGLLPVFKGLAQKQVDAIRFVPITAVTGLFIAWFGIGSVMKVNFLAFGIFIYLLPTMILRVQQVEDVYVKTVYTLGASKWQTFNTVFLPAVLADIWEDIRVLTAISWTYIIFIETTGSQGGLGQLIYSAAQRQGRVDKTFALLILILIIGLFQDRLFGYLDRKFFPHKYQVSHGYQEMSNLKEISLLSVITDYIISTAGYIFLLLYIVLALNEAFGFLGEIKPFEYFFTDRQWAIHTIGVSILLYQGYKLYNRLRKK